MTTFNKLTLQLDLWNSKLRSYLLGNTKYEDYLLEDSKEEKVFVEYLQILREKGFYDENFDKYYKAIKNKASELIEIKKRNSSLLEIAEIYKIYEQDYCLPMKSILLHIPKHFLFSVPKK